MAAEVGVEVEPEKVEPAAPALLAAEVARAGQASVLVTDPASALARVSGQAPELAMDLVRQ